MFFSKSKYLGFCQCPKISWLDKYKPTEKYIDESVLQRFQSGSEVGDLARNLFGDYVLVSAYKDGKIDINSMLSITKKYILEGKENIAEAAFSYDGLYCAIDILKKDGDGYSIYEVKSSTHPKKDVYIIDIAFQRYVLEKCGIKVKSVYTVTINGNYEKDGDIDIHKFFTITDCSMEVENVIGNVETNMKMAEEMLLLENEPDISISKNCFEPYECAYWKYCSKNLPQYSIFDLYNLGLEKKIENFNKGIISFEEIGKTNLVDNKIRKMQVSSVLDGGLEYVNKAEIKKYLSKLTYPLYFLDFETMQLAVPVFDGTKPFQQIPFQYSLHYIESENGEIKHKEFLAVSGEDPRRKIAESLVENIPDDACVLTYNSSFESGRIKELAAVFPDLSNHLLKIKGNIKDLIIPFKSGYYYKKDMNGSFSIKSVLPAIFPDDPNLNYHNLEDVHNGSEAMSIFPKIKDMNEEDRVVARRNLLKYCELDTLAMVKIWQELIRISK